MDLFERAREKDPATSPLADRMRPTSLDEVVGQRHLLADGKLLGSAIREDRVPSMVLWGPPGTGKTTLARVIAHETHGRFIPFSAVMGGVPELRKLLAEAAEQRTLYGKKSILFVDEIHRFNKSQQDALLPHVENGSVVLVGATTENPSFAVNAALLSRARVFRLESIDAKELAALLRRAMTDATRGLKSLGVDADDEILLAIAEGARGDARRALSVLETAALHAQAAKAARIDAQVVEEALAQRTLLYDKSGEEHYNVISAFIKSMRGSDPDAAIYWMMRMVEAGDDPLFILRRMIIFASEDVGDADPQALTVVMAADDAFRRLGMPEGLFAMAQACTYLASVPKSNASYMAWTEAQAKVREHGSLPVPMHLRNAPTQAMKEWGYGEGYRYPHDEAEGFAKDAAYLPEELRGSRFYQPREAGFESKIRARLQRLRGESDE